VRKTFDLSRVLALAGTVKQQRAHAQGRSWYRIEAKSTSAEVHLYDMIGEWGVTAQDFVSELKPLSGKPLDLHINSEGGEVFDGLAIFEALQRHDGRVTAYVDGLAASSASFIAMAADEIVMAERARMMVHDAHGLAIGNASNLRALAEILDDLSGNIADIYAARTGKTSKYWRDQMHGPDGGDGTWFGAQAAVDAGLADRIAEPRPRDSVPSTAHNDQRVDSPPSPEPVLNWDPASFLASFEGTGL
jgi:ATP-dependent protease ClpP protease subunit